MQFVPTELDGVWVVEADPRVDDRGSFLRTWCRDAFQAQGLDAAWTQCSSSRNPSRGTLRGLHFQVPPGAETKLVRCTRGAVYDVAVDLREGSPTFRRWTAVELSAENQRQLYIPAGLAHGFLSLEDHSDVYYQISCNYTPETMGGVRWDDPAFGIVWPLPPRVISERDQSYPDFPT